MNLAASLLRRLIQGGLDALAHLVRGGLVPAAHINGKLHVTGNDVARIGRCVYLAHGCNHLTRIARNFKNTLAGAEGEQIVEFMSVAGLPARGVNTPFLKSYLKREEALQANAKNDPRRCTQGINCLTQCGLRDGLDKIGQFSIDLKLAAAFRGEVNKGLFFRGKDPLPFGNQIRSVKDTIEYLLTGQSVLVK